MLVYFLALIKKKIDVMVTAELLPESKNDINRENIENSNYALYRGNMLKIVKIVDKFSNDYICFQLPYNKNQYNINDVINFTIIFYLTKERAIGANIPYSKFTGQITKWHENGTISKIINYKNGWKDGHYLENWPNGKIKIISEYIKGNINGEFRHWDSEGNLSESISYVNGKIIKSEFFEN